MLEMRRVFSNVYVYAIDFRYITKSIKIKMAQVEMENGRSRDSLFRCKVGWRKPGCK